MPRGDEPEDDEPVFDGDEEIDSDNAFDSEDERRYGHAFKKDAPPGYGEGSDDDPESDFSGDDSDYDGVVSVLDLIEKREAKAAAQAPKSKKTEKKAADSDAGSESDEDPNLGDHDALLRHVESMAANKRKRAAASASSADTSSSGGGAELTADDLLSSLRSGSGVDELKKRVERIENEGNAAKAPAARIVRKRAERKLGYVQAKQNATDWTALVKKNREAEHITFQSDMPDRVPVTTADMVDKFSPSTDMEKQINDLLTTSGMDESSLRDTEDRELALNTLTEEEVALRRSQLAKMRALLFYQEQKAKRVKKIKSKLYRKIRRKAREKHEKERREQLHATDPELARQMDEEDAKKRAQERFTLRHKNMSRWARTALKHGQVHAPGTKEAIEESLRIGQELKRKMQARKAADASSDSDSYFEDSDSESDGDDDEDNGGIMLREDLTSSSSKSKPKPKSDGSATSKARKLLAQIESDQSAEKAGTALSQKKGLMSLKFMQDAVARQRENARAEALGLLAELEQNGGEQINGGIGDEQSSSESSHKAKLTTGKTPGRRQMGNESSTAVNIKARQKGKNQDMSTSSQSNKKNAKGSIMSASVAFSGSVRTQMDGAVEVTSSELQLKPSTKVEETEEKKNGRGANIVLEKEESWGGVADTWNGNEDTWSSLPEMEKNQTKESHDGHRESESEAEASSEVLDPESMSYRELQAELKKRGKKASGKKVALVKTLQKILEGETANKKIKKVGVNRDAKEKIENKGPGAEDSDSGDDDAGGWLAQTSSEDVHVSRSTVGQREKEVDKIESGKQNDSAALASVGDASDASSQSRNNTSSDANGTKTVGEARQNELVKMAFAADNDVEAEFAAEKAEIVGEHANGGKKPEPVLAGWGSWTGAGALQAFPGSKKNGRRGKGSKWGNKNSKRKRGGAPPPPAKRRDTNLKHVIINEKRNKRAAKFLVKQAPHQFDSRDQYERSIRNPVGPEWNTSDSHARMTRPKMIVRGGNVIAPIKMPSMYKRKLSTINREFEAAQKAKRAKRRRNRNFKQ